MPTKEITIFGIKVLSIRWGAADAPGSEKPTDWIREQDRLILEGKHPNQQKKGSDCPDWITKNARKIYEPPKHRH